MKHKKLAFAAGAVGVAALTLTIGAAVAHAHGNNDQPTDAEVTVAAGTSDLMVSTLVAALVQEITETTPANAAQGSVSISLIFNDSNRDMRLVGTLDPLHENDRPQDSFERTALAKAMTGVAFTNVERDQGQWFYRRSVPLSNFAPQCQMCHANFASLASSDWVGALMIRVPIDTH